MIYIAQMDYGIEGKTEPVFVTESVGTMDAFMLGVEKSCGTSVYASKWNPNSNEITEYKP